MNKNKRAWHIAHRGHAFNRIQGDIGLHYARNTVQRALDVITARACMRFTEATGSNLLVEIRQLLLEFADYKVVKD